MGCFRIVHCSLACVRCGEVQSQGVQFKTGNDYEFPCYSEGEVVPDLVPGAYEGLGQVLCDPCVNDWLQVQREVCLQAASRISPAPLDSVVPKKLDLWPHGCVTCPAIAVSKFLQLSHDQYRLLQEEIAVKLIQLGWPAEMDQEMQLLIDQQQRIHLQRPIVLTRTQWV